MLDAAKAKGLRTGENPARWKGHLDLLLPRPSKIVRKHHEAMAWADVPAFMERLENLGSVSALALQFAILTAARSGEVLGARWCEFDLEAGIWKVPAERMKARVQHRVPLSRQAQRIVEGVRELDPFYLFPGTMPGKSLSNMAMEMLLRRLKLTVTVHGFRPAFRDWVGDETDYPREVAEAALAHKVGDEVERAYRRGDALEKRRSLMQAWSDFCLSRTSSEN